MVSGIVIEETIRRHLTHIGYGVYLAFLVILAFGVSRFDAPAAAWPSLIGLLAIITGCGPIGPEFSSGTLQLILVKPIRRSTYLLSRVIGVVSVIWLAAIVTFLVELIGRVVRGYVPWKPMSITLLNTCATALLTVALLTLLGSLTRSYLNVAIYVALSIALNILPSLLMIGRGYRTLAEAVVTVDRYLFPDVTPFFRMDWMLPLLALAATALVLACLAFQRREVPYGAD